MRVGFGWDIHRLSTGRNLVLGGVNIPSSLGEEGHSDGDVLIHAVIDALLGSAGMGDIGTLFPDSDTAYRDISSRTLLREVVSRLQHHSWSIVNVDTTVILESPKIGSHIMAIRSQLAEDLQISLEDVSVKAKTREGLDATGTGKAVEAYAVVLVED